ncbi:hypothetical protein FALBO_1235 [Fusarium albosuccineum]|uniref:Uncharacterized protein n=1 Tax=Fusarium albosuccineum TaxID=1237068 RepID=A0A8H4PDS0_9HYPO|nr:hypothetical protein FALBO_1235 [Fusarium albosuccineum]
MKIETIRPRPSQQAVDGGFLAHPGGMDVLDPIAPCRIDAAFPIVLYPMLSFWSVGGSTRWNHLQNQRTTHSDVWEDTRKGCRAETDKSTPTDVEYFHQLSSMQVAAAAPKGLRASAGTVYSSAIELL